MKTYSYQLNTFEGTTIEGTLVSHQRYLPKSARLTDCFYSIDFQMHSVYKTFGKSIKIFIVKNN